MITGSGVMTISFYKELTRNPENGNTLVRISGDWNEQGLPNLARTFLIKCYGMLQNAKITAFTASELFRENQLAGGGGEEGKFTPLPPPRLGLN